MVTEQLDCKMPIKATAIFDIGKTNKKLFLFDEQANVIYEKLEVLPETTDDDDFSCEDIELLEGWVRTSLLEVLNDGKFTITKLNFSAYGASLVHLDKDGKRIAPLYNYLKPLPLGLSESHYKHYGGKAVFSTVTASPAMGMLNSGLQLLWLKKEKPLLFKQIKCSLHLPQYLSYLFSGKKYNELTSIGCHTALWDFTKDNFHKWVQEENIEQLFPPIVSYTKTTKISILNTPISCGIGLHDSSSALIPYLKNQQEPFILLSTGTWSIALNPFSKEALTVEELNNNCLSYLSYCGNPVKASRLFFGYEHDYQVARLCAYFKKPPNYFKSVIFNSALLKTQMPDFIPSTIKKIEGHLSKNNIQWNFENLASFEQAYHQLVSGLVTYQVKAIKLAQGKTPIKTLFIDGGFAKNAIFITLLQGKLKGIKIITSNTPNASALGAYLLINNFVLDDETTLARGWR